MLREKIYQYTTIFEPAEEGGYVVHVPALPGCHTQGETFEDAKAMVEDAILTYLNVLKEDGDEIPIEPEGALVTKVATMLAD